MWSFLALIFFAASVLGIMGGPFFVFVPFVLGCVFVGISNATFKRRLFEKKLLNALSPNPSPPPLPPMSNREIMYRIIGITGLIIIVIAFATGHH
jgi:hypothetical protein